MTHAMRTINSGERLQEVHNDSQEWFCAELEPQVAHRQRRVVQIVKGECSTRNSLPRCGESSSRLVAGWQQNDRIPGRFFSNLLNSFLLPRPNRRRL